MKNRYCWITLFLTVLALSSCKDILEPGIDGKQVNTLSPGDQLQSKSFTINFWWEEVENASAYRLQIVTPKFDTISSLILDTLIKSTKFSVNIAPGNYQWRIRGENGGSKTPYSALKSFSVLPSSIKQQTVLLSSPGNNSLVKSTNVNFQWGSIYGATNYRLQLDTNNFSDTTKLLYNKLIPNLEAIFNFPKDQLYQWRVRAENDTAQSKWSAVRNIRYDHTPPGQVTLLSPANDKVVPLPVNLQWNPVSTATRYKVFVFKGDSTTLYNANFPVSVSTTSYSFNLGSSGDRIYWKVSALDGAGNEGIASKAQSFVLP